MPWRRFQVTSQISPSPALSGFSPHHHHYLHPDMLHSLLRARENPPSIEHEEVGRLHNVRLIHLSVHTARYISATGGLLRTEQRFLSCKDGAFWAQWRALCWKRTFTPIPYVPRGTSQVSKATFSKPLGGEFNIYHEKNDNYQQPNPKSSLTSIFKLPELEKKTEEH